MDQTYRKNLAISLGGSSPVLRRGASGDQVAELQAFLAQQGYDVGPVDGKFGRKTEDAVREFQMVTGVSVDGRVGNETRGAMDRVANAPIPKMRPLEPVEAVAGADLPPNNGGMEASGPTDPNGFAIDPTRPRIDNPDGSYSTERTITIQDADGGWVNIPSIVGGKQLSEGEATAAFFSGTNKPVQGPFKSVDEAVSAAEARSAAIPAARGDAYTPSFDDEMFSEAKPDLHETYRQAGGSEWLSGIIDDSRSSLTGIPKAKIAAYRRILQPEEWAARPGDGQDELREALLRSIMNRQGVPVAGGY